MSASERRRARLRLAAYGVARQAATARATLRRLAARDARLAALARRGGELDALLDLYRPAGVAPPPPGPGLPALARFVLPLAVLACMGGGFASAWEASDPADATGPVIEALALL